METKVTALAATPDAGASPIRAADLPARASEPPVTGGPDQADVRLVIEHDQASGYYIYKTINRLTGEILLQLPSAEMLKLHQGSDYATGSVIKTEA